VAWSQGKTRCPRASAVRRVRGRGLVASPPGARYSLRNHATSGAIGVSWKSLLACWLLLAGCGDGGGSHDGRSERTADTANIWVMSRADRSVTVIDAERAAVVRRISLGFRSDPSDLIYWNGSVWVGSSGGMLQRIDTAERRLVDTIPLEMDVWKVSAADHGIYAMDAERSLVSRHDTATGEVLTVLDPPDRIHAMAAGPESTAVLVGDRVELHFYAPGATESRVVRAELGGGDMVSGFGSFWIYHPDGRLLRVDRDSGAIAAELALAPDLYFPGIAVGDGAVWLAVMESQEVIRVDPATNRVTERIPVSGAPDHIAVHGGSLWLVLSQDDAVIRIDPATGAETARIAVDHPTRVVAVPG
jgi:DNA-binding beta-propeller fold protein YncE